MWAAVEPLDRRVFGSDYSDVALLGKAVTRSRLWPAVGLAVHTGNGAIFGLAYPSFRCERGTSRGSSHSGSHWRSTSPCTR
jgi:hypothetical protein